MDSEMWIQIICQIFTGFGWISHKKFNSLKEKIEKDDAAFNKEVQNLSETSVQPYHDLFTQKVYNNYVEEKADLINLISVPLKWPVVSVFISFVQVVIFYLLGPCTLSVWMDEYFVLTSENFYQLWRFLTPCLIHTSSGHLWSNVGLQLWFGCGLEIIHGWKRVFVLYFSSQFFASLITFTIETRPIALVCGASGASTGLIFGSIASTILNWDKYNAVKFRALITLCFSCISLFQPSNFQSTLETSDKGIFEVTIGNAAHFGGAVGGFVVGLLVLLTFKEHPCKIKMIIVALTLCLTALICTIAVYSPTII